MATNTYRIKVGEDGKGFDFHLVPGKNLYTGFKPFEKEFSTPNSLEEDVLNLAAGVYGADLIIKRQEREQNIRSIELTIDVVNLHAFERVKKNIENALFIVSRDNWTLKFIQKAGAAVSTFDWTDKAGSVLLFSGGLDSLSAAIKFLSENKDVVLLSHNSKGNAVVDESQRNVHQSLEDFFERSVRHIHITVYGRKSEGLTFTEDRENSQRTRSFLFLTLATLVTRRCGFNKVLFMAENGQFAIHLPLNQSRVGPFSTHTADPHFVEEVKGAFRQLLSNPKFEIENPFLYMTKAEVVEIIPKSFRGNLKYSASCWMISRTPEHKHCGYCVPCISRRIALEYHGINIREYDYDVFGADLNALLSDDDRKRNITDYLEFISKFKKVTAANKDQILMEFPELYNPHINVDSALELYGRVSQQSYKVLDGYPTIKKIL